ncbi:MAG: M50 family metallopeptidase [Gemmataceae bacterium]|nr:M50 family metallopeptidase [Gemmataceae bacterium]
MQIHWTFWLLPLWVVLTQGGQAPIAIQLLLLAAIFGCIVLHELGHALAARMYGIRTRNITLYPIGGVASLERISEKPAEELVIAAAGPAVNVAIALGLGAGMAVASAVAPAAFVRSAGEGFLSWLIVANLLLVAFNLIPAFPLDGGRMFRALLGFFTSYVKATRIAVYAGAVLTAILLGAVILFFPQFATPFLIVIAVFVFFAGQQELAMLEYRERMRQAADPFAGPVRFTLNDMPPWVQPPVTPPVTVHVWDPRTGEWVRQEQRM